MNNVPNTRPSFWSWDRPVQLRDLPFCYFVSLIVLGIVLPVMSVSLSLPLGMLFPVAALFALVGPLKLWETYRREQKAIRKSIEKSLASLRVYGR